MSERLEIAFPELRTTPYRITSLADCVYNCIAWAVGITSQWWWPLGDPSRFFWPASVPREVSVDAFVSALQTLGYQVCNDEAVETGIEKVALFIDGNGVPTHAARQLANGLWTSKLGQSEDIEHELRALEGEIYGTVRLLMKRLAATRETLPP